MPPSSSLTPLGVAALALLVERPMHPYEMYQTLVQRSEERVVKVRPGSLYHTVDRLAASGLVRATGTEREGNRPERTTYEITERGQPGPQRARRRDPRHPRQRIPRIPARRSGEAHNLPVETVIQLLRTASPSSAPTSPSSTTASGASRRSSFPRKYWLDVQYSEPSATSKRAGSKSLIHDLESGDISWTEEIHH